MRQDTELIRLALEVRKMSYAPYSGFAVGAALMAEDGSVYTGCNYENASFSATLCAERGAFAKAVSDGKRRFRKIAIAGGKVGEEPDKFCYPCGICRQVMQEFCGAEFQVILWNGAESRAFTLAELLPGGFTAEDMEKA